MFRKILVAVDESESAHRAVDAALDLARQFGSSVCLLHAFPHVADYLGSPTYERLVQHGTSHGQEVLESACHELDALADTVPIETQLLEGPPAPAILRVAETEGYDLIVVGSRGRHGLAGMLRNSVSQAVSNRAPCPVMVVH